MNPEERIKEIDKKITLVGIIDTPGAILLGLGLYAKFGADGDAFHPLLNNPTIVHAMLVAGAVITAWGGYRVVTLSKEKTRLTKSR